MRLQASLPGIPFNSTPGKPTSDVPISLSGTQHSPRSLRTLADHSQPYGILYRVGLQLWHSPQWAWSTSGWCWSSALQHKGQRVWNKRKHVFTKLQTVTCMHCQSLLSPQSHGKGYCSSTNSGISCACICTELERGGGWQAFRFRTV